MKDVTRIKWACSVLLLLQSFLSLAQSSAITYQGHLTDSSGPANGIYDFTFSLCTNSTGPAQMNASHESFAVSVSNGLFTVTLDFGTEAFDGSDRWLEISVRTNGAIGFSPLSPRQFIGTAPYAIRAKNVPASGIQGQITAPMLAPGAALTNLTGAGQGVVPGGGVLLSDRDNDTNLIASGYTKIGGYVSAPNLWRQRTLNPNLAPRAGHTAVWTGTKMLVWGGYCGNENPNSPPPIAYFSDGGAYDPATDSWTPVTTNAAPPSRKSFVNVWTGSELIIWSGYTFDTAYNYVTNGSRYHFASNIWLAVATSNAPPPRSLTTAIWTGTEMIVWGGFFGIGNGVQYVVRGDGARYNPVSDTWTSQAYFPRGYPVRSTKFGKPTESVVFDAEERERVRGIFKTLAEGIKRTGKKLQIIVLEHADEDTWDGVPHVRLVERWRDEKTPKEQKHLKLVPDTW